MRKKQVKVQKDSQRSTFQVLVEQARHKWLWQKVQVDLQKGDGVRLGMVMEVSDEGMVMVACLPGHERGVPSVTVSLGFVDRVLMLVEK